MQAIGPNCSVFIYSDFLVKTLVSCRTCWTPVSAEIHVSLDHGEDGGVLYLPNAF